MREVIQTHRGSGQGEMHPGERWPVGTMLLRPAIAAVAPPCLLK